MFTETLYAKKGITAEGLRRVSPERKEFVRKESAMLLTKNMITREKAKQDCYDKRRADALIREAVNDERLSVWQQRTKNSPFAVDLIAESERITEENFQRSREEKMRTREFIARRAKAKNDIVLKALSEFSDLEVLRREKRAIMDEEQRLKALLAIEKTQGDRKGYRQAAEHAQRQRLLAQKESRRVVHKSSYDSIMHEEIEAIKRKSGQ